MLRTKHWFGLAVSLVMLFVAVVPAQAQVPFPAIIPLPDGFRPEGIVAGYGTDFYAGSLADGAIYKGDFRTGAGAILIPGVAGRSVTGLEFDPRTGYLFASGAGTGMAWVFDTATGQTVQEYAFAQAPVFINDVAVTRRAAYFTDSQNARLFVVPLSTSGEPAAPAEAFALPLSGEWEQVAGFNANGIVGLANGKALIVVNSTSGKLYRVDGATGAAQVIDLGGESVTQGDGLLTVGKFLYVVRNRMNLIAVFRLAPNLLSGHLVKNITDPNFDVPTTIAHFGRYLYAVNARFTTPPGPDVDYWVTRVNR